MQEATAQVAYPLQPVIFVAQYSMPMGCGRGIRRGGFRLHAGAGHGAAHGTGGKTDMRIASYPFHLPSVREGVDIQDAMLFRKPDRGLNRCSIPFATLQIEISLTREWGKAL